MPTIADLGKQVKAKYPAYADMDDAQVGKLVKQKYPDAYNDFTDAPPALSTPKSVGGFAQNAVQSAGNLIGGIGTALLHPINTAENLGDVAYGGVLKGMKAVGIPGELDDAEKQKIGKFDSVVDNYKNRYGSLDKIGNTLYTDPVGAAADVSMAAGAVGAGLKAGGMANAARTAEAVSQATNPVRMLTKGVEKAGEFASKTAAPRVYASALGSGARTGLTNRRYDAMIERGLDDGAPAPNRASIAKVQQKIDQGNAATDAIADRGTDAGATVDVNRAANATATSADKFSKRPINQTKNLTDIEQARQDFLNQHGALDANGGEIPVKLSLREGLDARRNIGADLDSNVFDKAQLGAKDAWKTIYRDINTQMFEQYPELKQLGQNTSARIDLQKALERAVKNNDKKQLVSFATAIRTGGATTAGALAGGPAGAAAAATLASVLELPAVKAKLALALRSANRATRYADKTAQPLNTATRVQPNQQ